MCRNGAPPYQVQIAMRLDRVEYRCLCRRTMGMSVASPRSIAYDIVRFYRYSLALAMVTWKPFRYASPSLRCYLIKKLTGPVAQAMVLIAILLPTTRLSLAISRRQSWDEPSNIREVRLSLHSSRNVYTYKVVPGTHVFARELSPRPSRFNAPWFSSQVTSERKRHVC